MRKYTHFAVYFKGTTRKIKKKPNGFSAPTRSKVQRKISLVVCM